MTIRHKHSFWFGTLAIVAGSIFLFGRSADKQEDNSEVKFTAKTELVLVPAIVTDKSGNHINGLTKEDFTVLENGAERQIAIFEEVQSKPGRLAHPADTNEFSNFVAGERSTSRITIIVLDFINTPFMAQAVGRQELLKYLTESLETREKTQEDTREPTALYTLTRSGIQVVHDFTSDPQVLLAALHQVKGDAYQMVDSSEQDDATSGAASSKGSTGGSSTSSSGSKSSGKSSVQAEAARLQGMLQESALNFRSFEQRLAITYTLEGMQQVAQALAGFPGRKSLIWASGGFPFSVSDNSMHLAPAGRDTLSDVLPLYEHTWQLLNDAEISLYPVDLKGLQVVTMPNASIRNPGRHFNQRANFRQLDTQSTFQTFASATGGRAYFNSNDLVKGFRDAVNDSSQYYMLGYYLDHSQTKPGWRKLTVKVKREHTEVRARNGFFITNATTDPESSRKSDITSALRSPLDYTSLALSARWGKMEAATDPGQKRVFYQIHLPPDAGVINEADNNHLTLEVVALAFTPDGKDVGQPVGQKVDVHVAPAKLAAIQKQGLAFVDALNMAPGEYTVRFVVRDDFTGRTGSVAAPLKVD
jgi:VWFA-related protein